MVDGDRQIDRRLALPHFHRHTLTAAAADAHRLGHRGQPPAPCRRRSRARRRPRPRRARRPWSPRRRRSKCCPARSPASAPRAGSCRRRASRPTSPASALLSPSLLRRRLRAASLLLSLHRSLSCRRLFVPFRASYLQLPRHVAPLRESAVELAAPTTPHRILGGCRGTAEISGFSTVGPGPSGSGAAARGGDIDTR